MSDYLQKTEFPKCHTNKKAKLPVISNLAFLFFLSPPPFRSVRTGRHNGIGNSLRQSQ